MPCRSGGFFSKILKKRPHKEAQTPDNGETLAQILNERPTGGEGKYKRGTVQSVFVSFHKNQGINWSSEINFNP